MSDCFQQTIQNPEAFDLAIYSNQNRVYLDSHQPQHVDVEVGSADSAAGGSSRGEVEVWFARGTPYLYRPGG